MAKRRTKDPRRLAAKAVEEWFNSLLYSAESHSHGSIFQVTLDEAFDAVTQALRAEHVKEYGEGTGDEQRIDREMHAREAGYLIGVQVGLRLRETSPP